MKQKLATIYRELSAGKLSPQQALESIKALNQPVQTAALETLFASPAWERCAPPADEAATYAQHHVLLWGLPQIATAELQSLLPRSRCATAPTARADDVSKIYTAVALAYFETIQRILRAKPDGRSLVQLVVADRDEAHLLAGLQGLIETAALENPAVVGQIVFVPSGIALAELAQRLRMERNDPRERIVRYTGNARLSRRWRRIDTSSSIAAEVPCAFKEQGVYLITGGLGGLGTLLAKEILNRTSGAKLFLTGRTAAKDTKLAALESLRHIGGYASEGERSPEGIPRETGRVEYRQVDVADVEAVEQLLAEIVEHCGQLNGIIHSAGLLRDDFILKKSSAQFSDVLQPKVAGTANLDRASAAIELDFFVLFSSIASWAGNVGQVDYAAANGFMDQFAGYRNALVAAGKRNGKTLAIAWPHWLDGGMHIDATSMGLLEQRTGLRSLETQRGMEALHRCLALSHDAIMVMRGNTADLCRALDAERTLRPATSPTQRDATVAATGATGLVAKTRELLRKEFAPVLKIPVHKIETGVELENYGIDSIVAMNLTNQLERTFGTLPKTLFFEYRTINELADHFVRAHADTLSRRFAVATVTQAPASASSTSPQVPALPTQRRGGRRDRQRFLVAPTQPSSNKEPIAIVGLSGRYPASKDLEAFWRNLRDGKDCITEVPSQRWDWRQYYSEDRSKQGAHFSKWGGFIEGADEFDPRFFNIAPREAPTIDPQERLFLQHAWMAIEDAGYTRARLQIPNESGLAGQVGVYAGVMYGEYNVSGTLASIANRVSYFLNLHGPSLTLDTMCSSSLTAIHLACQDLRSGRTSLGIAGGVNLTIHPNKYRMLSAGQFISTDGHCQSFGEGGDGYIPGEGVGVAVLKRLSDAERDGDHIYGVIRGSALNHGGKTNGYTVPNPQAQAEVIRRALIEAGVDPRHMSYIEAHGTGTKLGDPIEIAALTKAFYDGAPSVREGGFCLIGSAKSNIGHCESAAGIAGVSKVLLQMKHAAIVPSLHSTRLNPHIDFKSTPFVVNQTLRPWEQQVVDGRRVPRIAGISSFGAGGSNAHVIIEEYRAPEPVVAAVRELLIVPLSARTAHQLQQRVRDLLAFIQRGEHSVDLHALAWTLQVGREAMEERAAFLAISVDDLIAKLQAFLQGHNADDAIHCAQVTQHKEEISQLIEDPDFHRTFARWIEDRELSKLARLWVKGWDLDWRKLLDASGAPRLMSLPTYPFATERYWIEPSTVAAAATASPMATLHPLVHANTSDISQQRYTSRFTGRESFFDDDSTAGPRMLPSLLVLEMIRAAVELAAPSRSESGQWELRETVWGEPLAIFGAISGAISGDRNVDITLFPRADDAIDVEIYSKTDDVTDRVYCQSHAVHSRLPAPSRVDIERLKADGDGKVLAALRLPARSDNERVEYALHPELLKQVAQLLNRTTGAAWSPMSLARLRIVFACPQNVIVWLRHSSSTVDIDVCDEQGNVCVQMVGLRGEHVAIPEASALADARTAIKPIIDTTIAVEPAAAVAPILARPVAESREIVPREIVLVPLSTQESARQLDPISPKPTGVRLLPSAEVPSGPVPAKAKAVLAALSAQPASAVTQDASLAVRLFDLGDGVYAIEITGAFDAAIELLLQALTQARNESSLKVLLLIGRHADSWRGDRNACNTAIERRLLSTVVSFSCPVIAVVPSDAMGAGLLLASVCDFLVCSEDGQYGFTDIAAGIVPSDGEDRFFRERLGDVVADDLLYRTTRYSGRQLNAKGWACRVAPPAQVEVDAKRLAAELSRKSQLALGLLKTHLSRHLGALIDDLIAVAVLPAAIPAKNAGDSALVVTLGAHREGYDLQALIADLKVVLERVEASSEYKSVVLASALDGFLPETNDSTAVAELQHLVDRYPVPVIAAFESNAEGWAWLFGLFCDAVVYSNDGRYCASALWAAPVLSCEIAVLCAQRFGTLFGQEVCLTEGSYSGAELKARAGSLVVVDRDEVMPQALRLAAFWNAWPRQSIVAWKQAQSALRQQRLARLPELQISDDGSDSTAVSVPTAIALRSNVVSVTAYPEGVVAISMQDQGAKNMFSDALVSGLKEAFAHIAQIAAYKAVVLTGYGSYFATGGTMETLLAIQQGQARFTDEKVFQLPMECPLPVIAAIQGHSIGGGWSFGMYADLILLSEESRYLSPYMGYGFTPGAGSTLMFPEKIGYDLARETLLTAQEMSGHELQQRGVSLLVLPRADVVSSAIELAKRIARHPRDRLIALKRLWTHALRESCEDVYRREVEMHELTFVSNRETLATIQSKLSPAKLASESGRVATAAAPIAVTSSRGGEDLDSVIANLKAMLAKELLLRPEEIGDSVPFIDLGLDSINGVTWVRKINEHYQTDIEATKVYGHPTLLEMSRLVQRETKSAGASVSLGIPSGVRFPSGAHPPVEPTPAIVIPASVQSPVQSAPAARRALKSWRQQARSDARLTPRVEMSHATQPIAVIGVAGQFPQANTLEQFWANLSQGRNCIAEVPETRWRARDYFQPGAATPGKTNSKWLGALDEYDLFDPLFFNISPTEAECMEPQQRVFLQACWHSIENAGYNPHSLAGSSCGVFVGCGPSDYHQASPTRQLSAQGFTGAANSILAARISYFLNLRGPCVAIETACSSSLVAIANACDSLNGGNSDLALAGGVYVMAGPNMHVMTAQAGMLSTDGRCFTFDQRANGFVPGEAVGALLLKRLADAERDGDRIQAVIEGWGVNQDGKTNGITAPNEESQTRLIQSVYRKFGIDPAGIQLIEAHGTGTKLGDPIEVAGLKAAFRSFTDKSGYCALGSVKSNIGHCLTAAGVAGFIKVMLALKHKALPPTINFEQRNEHIKLDGSSFYVNDTLKSWDVANGERRRAAISSFGFSGTNAHLVIAEHISPARLEPEISVVSQDGKIIVPLSAKTPAQLRQQAQQMLTWLRARAQSLDLMEVAYTLQIGREPMDERLGFLVDSIESLAARLEAYLAGQGEDHRNDSYQGQSKRHKEEIKLLSQDDEMKAMVVEKWLGQRKLSKLLDLWVKGLDLDWTLLYGAAKPRRIELPGYPFAKQRFWIDGGAQKLSAGAAADVLHPLLHQNASLLSRQRYRSIFSGEEFFFDAAIDGAKVLSPWSLLEMARAAVVHATSDLDRPTTVQLGSIRWEKPLFVDGSTEVAIDLFANDDDSVSFEIGTGASVHVRGVAHLVEPMSPARVDISALTQLRAERFDAAAFYAGLTRAGLDYATALQGLKTVYPDRDHLLAHIGVPGRVDTDGKDYALHPSLLEAVAQACMIFVGDANTQPLLPVAIDSLTLLSACEREMYAWIRYADQADDAGRRKIDIDLLDAQGDCRVAIRGLALGPATARAVVGSQPETVMMVPRWDVVRDFDDVTAAVGGERIAVIGANDQQRSVLQKYYRESTLAFIDIDASDAVADICTKLDRIELDQLIWIAAAQEIESLTEESIIEDQNRGILQALRIVRALTALGYEKRALVWDLITINALPVRPSDVVNPTHAGLQGFAGSMAEVCPRWKIRLLDLQQLSETALAGMRRLRWRMPKTCYALRGDEWLQQKLIRVHDLAQGKAPYREQGVYVVIGGAGGIGEIWTRHVIEHYQANVIWIGRRELDDDIRQKMQALSGLGKTPEYLRADASNRHELEAAYRQIKRKYPAIHGVVHSAVGAFDQSLKTVSEDDFRAILAVKIDLSVRVAQVFADEALDLVLFFSSNASFVSGAGMSGYSSGCAFKDAFALQLAKRWSQRCDCAVKVINWGYWSVGAGVALTEPMKAYFHEMGYRSLDPAQAMEGLDRFIASGFDQMSMSAMQPTAEHLDRGDESMIAYADESDSASAPLDLSSVNLASKFDRIEHKAGQQMEDLLSRLLRSILSSTPNILRHYDRWLLESKKIVAADAADDSAVAQAPEQLWAEWDRAKQVWLQDSGTRALCVLVDKCVRALPDVLTGAQKATDVIFPSSSLELVEKVYKTDTISLAYNESLRDVLTAAVQARLNAAPEARIRLLEIGAGTGGTTVGILDKLEPHRSRIAEYCYTDVSRAFLLHAENIYAPRAPYLRTQLFNVEQPIAGQQIEAGRYDFVIAANVIHATKNIRNTLRNAKATLRKHGMLLLNEVSDKSICGHLTFGLLDGWWLNEDDEVRIPGSPGLYPEVWKRVLEEEGFYSVQFPCSEVHAAGQQIIVAFSDGVVRQKRAVKAQLDIARAPPVAVSIIAPKDNRERVNVAELLPQKTVQWCKQLLGKTLKISPIQIDADEPLERYGIDSILVGLINQELKKHFDDIRSTVLFEFQTVQALSEHLVDTQRPVLERLLDLQPPAPIDMATNGPIVPGRHVAARSLPVRSRRATGANRAKISERQPIAIVGISGLYPGAADIEEFWENLQAGKNCIGTIPDKRWSLEGFYEPDVQRAVEQGKSYCKCGGFVDQFAQFDTLFFGIPPKEALNMDPQERLFMQAAWSALENAGYTRGALRHKYRRRVGVFAGITRAGYNLYRSRPEVDDRFWPRTSFSSVANRLSYFLDINGPSLPVDTMCSSSLTAIHEACEHIHNGDCDLAFAGGVNLYLHPTSFVDMSSQRMLSKEGLCKSFGAGGDGFVPGEGVGVVLLKSLDRAVADNDIIHGLILATHVNHGGKTNGFTVPNPVAQAELIRAAIDKANISARDISYIEAHGTGTELGDPIEITGLQQAFAKDTRDTGYCRIGSAKSNIGHLEAAAGIAGLTKVLLQLKHRQIVPSLHASTLNPHIDFASTPFEVNRALVDWEQPVVDGMTKPRIAGISSFGAGGANAHVILQEYQPATARPTTAPPGNRSGNKNVFVVPLSAKTSEQLQQRASDLFDFLSLPDTRVDLAALAYTLQTGREPMEKRVGFVVDSVEQLTMKLSAYVCGERDIDGVHRGEVKRNNDRVVTIAPDEAMSAMVDQWVARKEYSKLLERWVEGLELDWNRCYGEAKPPRIALPTYPFARDEYWLDSAMRTPASDSLRIIEDIIDQIDGDAIDAAHGVRLLKQLGR